MSADPWRHCFEVKWSEVKWSEVNWSEVRFLGNKVPCPLVWHTEGTWL
jgi:hypothetical protein